VHPKRVKRNADARAGDRLVLGKPLGVGVLSAALKKEQLDAAGYARMIEVTTRLNTPGPELAKLPGVHALTDITGFGLAGHALELARGAGARIALDWARVPLLPGVVDLARAGCVTGASGRNWAGYGQEVALPAGFDPVHQALLSDPQTSGGLLVSCAPQAVDAVLGVFRQHGFGEAAVVGEVMPAAPGLVLGEEGLQGRPLPGVGLEGEPQLGVGMGLPLPAVMGNQPRLDLHAGRQPPVQGQLREAARVRVLRDRGGDAQDRVLDGAEIHVVGTPRGRARAGTLPLALSSIEC